MSGDLIIWGKACLGIITVLIALLLYRYEGFFNLSNRYFTLLAVGLISASRIAIFVALYVILNINVPSDIPAYYVPQGHAVLQGLVVYRDFYSSYAPGFGYVVACILSAWDSPKAIVLFTIATEIAAIPIWINAARGIFPEEKIRYAFLLYLSNSLPLVTSAIAGQNQLWVNLLLASSWLFLVNKKPILSGFAMSASLVLVKILGLLFAPILWLVCPNKYRWTAGFLLPMIVYIFLVAIGVDIITPIRGEIDNIYSGNLPYLMACLNMEWLTNYAAGVLVFVLVALFLYVYARFSSKDNELGWYLTCLVVMLFMLLSKKSPTYYLSMFLFMFSVTVAMTSSGWKGILSFGIFGLIASLEPTLWFRWASQSYLNFNGLINGSVPYWETGKTIGFIFLEVLLLLFYAKYAVTSWMALLKCRNETVRLFG